MSKRVRTVKPEPVHIEWPIELLIHIARQSNWYLSGPFARCSKSMFVAFTEKGILGEIISSIKATYGRPMLRWLVLALPSFMYPNETLSITNLYNECSVVDFLAIYYPKKKIDPFVGGDKLCGEIYEKVVRPVSTIFMPRYTHSLSRVHRSCFLNDDDIRIHDVPWLDRDPERIIETVDHSLIQQGFIGQTYYQTPLAVYTRLYKDVAIMPSDENIQPESNGFTIRDPTPPINIWQYIDYHVKEKHECEAITTCGSCTNNLFIVDCDNNGDYVHVNPFLVIDWFDRVDTIMEKFSDFTFFWCRPAK